MINIIIKSSSRYPIRRKIIKKAIITMLAARQVEDDFEVEVNIIGDRKMRELKKIYLKIDETTDVLSFPLQDDYFINKKKDFIDNPDNLLRLGTIFISYPQARRQANLHKLLIDEEINQLTEHGMLHLLGFHHE
ncbi:rRNA maturation RNase YbeY [Candidatus Beckwithbacteria bacterium]|nr:rRNA maturation RNase YbeY [Candidatus Beckwithbacteria bacterium]